MGRIYNTTDWPLPLEQRDSFTYYNPKDLKPNPQIMTPRRFREPKTILSDWYNNLMEDKPYVNYTFTLLNDWFDQDKEDYVPYKFRGQQTSIDWKSKIGNSDASWNLKTLHDVPLHKGDYVIREDGMIYLVNWAVQAHANNYATQIASCNAMISFTREVPDEVDNNGYLITPAHMETVVKPIPCISSEYQGRPDFNEQINTPGITPDHIINLSTQWSPETRQLEIGDHFVYGKYEYHIIDLTMTEVSIDESFGLLTIRAKRENGGHQ